MLVYVAIIGASVLVRTKKANISTVMALKEQDGLLRLLCECSVDSIDVSLESFYLGALKVGFNCI